MKNILGMNFPDTVNIDIGSMEMDKHNQNLHLLAADILKLNSVLTRSVCIGDHHADTFSFQTGDVAVVDNAPMRFVYNSTSDRWYEQGDSVRPWYNPDDVSAGWIEFRLFKDGAVYVLEDDEKIICNIVKDSDDTVLFSKTLLKWHYRGGGYYIYDLGSQEIETLLAVRNDFRFAVGVAKGENETDITGEFTFKDMYIMNMIYDEENGGDDENAE